MNLDANDQQNTLFLGDLSCFCQETDILRVFQPFGEIKQIRLMRSKHDGKCLGYGFITFTHLYSAMQAIEQANGTVLLGRTLIVKWSRKSDENVKKPKKQSIGKFHPIESAEIHFSFVSKQRHFAVTEATLRAIFEEFGPVQDISLKKTELNHRGEQTGYGFIHYPLTPEGVGAAVQAANVICQLFVDNVLYDCCLTHSLILYLEQQNGRPSSFHANHYNHPPLGLTDTRGSSAPITFESSLGSQQTSGASSPSSFENKAYFCL